MSKQVSRYAAIFSLLTVTACVATGSQFSTPLPDTFYRATPLSFGMYVTPDPKENPISPPERFVGYHVGTDFEVSVEELHKDVPVFAICSGTGAFGGFAGGYGGLFVQECTLGKQEVIVLYGHLAPNDLPTVGSFVRSGEQIGVLAPASSGESDGNRKHLHLGIRKGPQLDIRGYVQTEAEIEQYIDPQSLLPHYPDSMLRNPIRPYWAERSSEER